MKQVDFDIMIIGAGISGIGNAYWLQRKCPDKKIVILEARDTIGGTWSLFQYPGIRSDSDMFTFGYRFKPWNNPQALSSGEKIKSYLDETVAENNLLQLIRFGHKMTEANWSSENRAWEVEVETDDGKVKFTTHFLSICTGYYNYHEAYRPNFPGEDAFQGQVILPQFWPGDLDYQNKKIAVVGSGATAITLVPSLIKSGARHVTMIQRSPTYVVSLPNHTKSYSQLQKWMPIGWAYRITRIQNILFQIVSFTLSKLFPKFMKNFFMKMAQKQLPDGYPVEKHFNPSYAPWDQRLCVVPNGDLFKVIKAGKAEIATDQIANFTPNGIQLASGKLVEADIIVLATGLKMQLLGGASLRVNGIPYNPANAMVYKGMMLSGLPNFIYSFGYTNASWTLKADLTANYLCKLMKYMHEVHATTVVPIAPQKIDEMDFLNLSSGYIKRAESILPKNGTKKPWRVHQNYILDMLATRYAPIPNNNLKFE